MFFRVGDIIIKEVDTNHNNSCYFEYFTETLGRTLLKVNIKRDIFTTFRKSIINDLFYKIDNDENIDRTYKVTGHSLQLSHKCDEDNYMYGIIIYLKSI
jgi:hypothetical protein